jgi:hypothetical protein
MLETFINQVSAFINAGTLSPEVGGSLIRSRWPDWWERWIAAPYSDELEAAADDPRTKVA